MRSMPHLTVMSGLCLLLLASCGLGDPAPPADTSPLPVSARSVGEPAGSPAGPTYTLPTGWERQPPTSGMRVEQFRLP